jgi:hypothetical protein
MLSIQTKGAPKKKIQHNHKQNKYVYFLKSKLPKMNRMHHDIEKKKTRIK